MNGIFVPVWLALGGLMSIIGMLGLAMTTKNRSVTLTPGLSLAAFAVTTMLTIDRGPLVCALLSILAWLIMWMVLIGVFALVAYVDHRLTRRRTTR